MSGGAQRRRRTTRRCIRKEMKYVVVRRLWRHVGCISIEIFLNILSINSMPQRQFSELILNWEDLYELYIWNPNRNITELLILNIFSEKGQRIRRMSATCDASNRAPQCLSISLFWFEIYAWYKRKKSKILWFYNFEQHCRITMYWHGFHRSNHF